MLKRTTNATAHSKALQMHKVLPKLTESAAAEATNVVALPGIPLRQANHDITPSKVSAQGVWIVEIPAPCHGIFSPQPCPNPANPPKERGGLRRDDDIVISKPKGGRTRT